MDKLFEFLYKSETLNIILDGENNIWFCANDIARLLKYKAPKKAIQKYVLDKHKKNYEDLTDIKKMHPGTMFINESGMFRLIMKSKQKNALEFQEWITDEVLPSLRKTGIYTITESMKNNILKLMNKYKKLKEENTTLKDLLSNNKFAKYGIVYAKESESINRKKTYKIGYTNNLINRDKNYKTGHVDVKEYKYYIEVNDAEFVEKIVKRKLFKYKVSSTTELYNCSLETIKELMNATKTFYEIELLEDIMTDSITSEDDSEFIKSISNSI